VNVVPQPPRAWEPRAIQAGSWRVTALLDGYMRLDGGAMWGVVPRAVWEELTPPDAGHTILLALRPFLSERGDAKVLIEVGVGQRCEPKWRERYRLLPTTTLDQSLAACGLAPDDVTHVVASHCHWDHIGSAVVEREGALAPHFRNARVFAPAVEVERALRPDPVRRASYRAEDVVPLEEAGLLETYDPGAELIPGIRAHDARGHSDGLCVLTINEEDPGDTAIFWADVVPTTHHIQPPYIMAYDLDQTRSYEARSHWLAKAAAGGWLGLFYHDAEHAFGRLRREGERYALDRVEGVPVPPA
jgi:glyoxylase-like metal-dependent hydrolase (beta-lactamase superfamily II)